MLIRIWNIHKINFIFWFLLLYSLLLVPSPKLPALILDYYILQLSVLSYLIFTQLRICNSPCFQLLSPVTFPLLPFPMYFFYCPEDQMQAQPPCSSICRLYPTLYLPALPPHPPYSVFVLLSLHISWAIHNLLFLLLQNSQQLYDQHAVQDQCFIRCTQFPWFIVHVSKPVWSSPTQSHLFYSDNGI